MGDREAFLDAALEIFAARGFEGASMRELARELDVSHRLLHTRFGSKQELWKAAVDHGLRQLEERTNTALQKTALDGDAIARLRAFCVAFLVALADAPAILKLMNSEGARDSERLDDIAKKFLASNTSLMAELLAEGVAQGMLRETSVATFFLVLAHGGGALLCLRPLARHLGVRTQRSPTTIRTQAEEVADMLLHGLTRPTR